MSYSRFAVYYVPPEGPLAEFGAAWLGWDIARGQAIRQFDLPGLRDIAMGPSKYGFHGTLKPPFRLSKGHSVRDLDLAIETLAGSAGKASCAGLEVTSLGRFLALTPRGRLGQLQRLAEACVRDLDRFRAPPRAAELARRRKAGLSTRQDALLSQWGYPYVLEEFRFHMTLSGRLPEEAIPAWRDAVHNHLPTLSEPFLVDQIALCGEREDGRFEVVRRYSLAG